MSQFGDKVEGLGTPGSPLGGVVTVQGDPGGTGIPVILGGTVDVSDRIARLLGVVDTELAPATVVGDGEAISSPNAQISAVVRGRRTGGVTLDMIRSWTTAQNAIAQGDPGLAVIANLYGSDDAAATMRRVIVLPDSSDAQPTTAGARNLLATIARLYGYNGASFDRLMTAADNADAVAVATLGRLLTIARGTLFNGTTWDRWRGDDGHTYGDHPADAAPIIVTGAANAIATATLPAAGAGLFHYITHLFIKRVATAALAGGALLTVTTTNLGGRAWRTGNQMSITVDPSDTEVLIDQEFMHPLKSAVANTASTIVGPAAGAAVSWHMVVEYYIAP